MQLGNSVMVKALREYVSRLPMQSHNAVAITSRESLRR